MKNKNLAKLKKDLNIKLYILLIKLIYLRDRISITNYIVINNYIYYKKKL